MEAAGFVPDPEDVTEEDEERMAEFRAFLDDIDPSDFQD
jgi:hypothetical protein